MRYETNLETGEVTEHEDAPATPEAPPTVRDQLNQLDADNALTQRNLRETVMLMVEAFKTISGGALDLSQIPGVQKVYAVEAEAAALRATL
jgi:hypothetical protein